MTPQELKNSILQLAIQGKLVEQRGEDGSASTLLMNVDVGESVDGQRVKKKSVTEVVAEDVAFEIPESWEWVKLGSICTIARGGSPRPIKEYITTSDEGVNWIKIGDTDKNGKYICTAAEKIKPSGVSKSRVVHAGDFLLTNSMSFGRPYILKIDGCIHDGWLVLSQSTKVFDQDYLYWLLSSQYAYSQFCEKVSGAVVKNLNSEKVANSVFPLPPLAEQKRIVAKIEELLPLIDRYEKAWSRLEDFNKRFPTDMQKSILQLAIQGKLVEQRPEDGTGEELYQQIQAEKQKLIKEGKIKKEKPLPEITEDEMDIAIPDTWNLFKLGEISAKITDGEHKTPRRVTEYCGYYLLSARNIRDGYLALQDVDYVDENEFEIISKRCNPQKGDVLISCSGSVGRCAVINDMNRYVMVRSAAMVSPIYVDSSYMMFAIQSEYIQQQIRNRTKQTAQANLFQDAIKNLVIPLPPLAEQKRIVARLEELLPMCNQLK